MARSNILERIVVKELGKEMVCSSPINCWRDCFIKTQVYANVSGLITNIILPELHEAPKFDSGINALRYGNPLINKYHATEPGHDLRAVSTPDLR